ncbi:MAG: hypothetical protein LRY41_00250 [Candidatus Pacebacteria bacterium]|nr:hypothetical protein [Candidatus Paceibacterota bacterium]
MSSRLGGVPTAVELLDTLRSDVYEKNTDASDDLADAIALAAIKFTILKTQAGKNINFDPDQSLSFEGDSGPYLQYTHARIQSLLTKGEGMGIHPRIDGALSEEVLLERMLYRFPHILERVIKDYSPHHLAHYALEVARVFNSWYGGTKILDPENPHAPYYLGLAQATGIILERSLYLLGIHAPERM